MRFKAVLFDLGWTIIKTQKIHEIYRRILASHGVKVSSDDILRAHKENEKEVDVVKGQIELGRNFWIGWNTEVLKRIGVLENREFLAQKIDELWWEHADLEVYSDVVETLTQLRVKGVKIGLVTNGLKSDYQVILRKLELTSYFDITVGVDSCDKGKPEAEIFLYALNKLNVTPSEALFIGDSIKYDYEGAKRAGLKPLLIDREGKVQEVQTKRSLTEVLSLI